MNASSVIIPIWLASLGQTPVSQTPTQRTAAIVARPVAILAAPPDLPMVMPTGVAVGPSGRIYVADGVNDRIVEFDETGRFVGSFHAIDNQTLSRPMSLKVDASGNLWIADTGHGRVLVRDTAGRLSRRIDVPAVTELTDIAVDQQVLWIVDNDGHQIVRHDLANGTFAPYGAVGEARGQFHYPFMAAVRSGALLVSDVINGRVQSISDFQTIPRVFGTYGVAPGQFHRPKGIAVDGAGRVFVADGSLGVIQAFSGEGQFLDAVRTAGGEVMHFELPCGIAIAGDNLFVTELLPGHVRMLRLEVGDVQPSLEIQRPEPHRQPSTCTACHLEWMPHFTSGAATELSPPPRSRPDEPYVSSARSCATCHDGSVADSRKSVWQDHGHQTGVEPPPGVKVPRDMPLVDGKLGCRTCHSAHTHGGAGQGIEDAVFLRVSKHPEELCIRCHSDYQGVGVGGMHPTRGFAEPLHPDLVNAGSRFSFEPEGVGCLICHTAHGSGMGRLMVPVPSTDHLCGTCHSEVNMRGASFHPLTASISTSQRSAIEAMGTHVTQDGRLQCVACHKVHHAEDQAALLARPQAGSSLCLECHAEFGRVAGTPHDLSLSGTGRHESFEGCDVSGPCASCHGVHSIPRQPVITAIDREGACITCHQAGACAQSRTGQPFAHPSQVPQPLLAQLAALTGREAERVGDSLSCLSCHDPHGHEGDVGFMLRGPAGTKAADLCFECHAETRPIEHSFHSRQWMGGGDAEGSDCRSCHAVHAPTPDWSGGLWVAPSGDSGPVEARWCTGCHSAQAGRHDVAFRPHPVPLANIAPLGSPGFMPLVDAAGQSGPRGALGCITCHVAHGREAAGGLENIDFAAMPEPILHAAKPMLRPYVAPNLCSSCHGAEGLKVFLYYHSWAAERQSVGH